MSTLSESEVETVLSYLTKKPKPGADTFLYVAMLLDNVIGEIRDLQKDVAALKASAKN